MSIPVDPLHVRKHGQSGKKRRMQGKSVPHLLCCVEGIDRNSLILNFWTLVRSFNLQRIHNLFVCLFVCLLVV